jgi:hypothetical protein
MIFAASASRDGSVQYAVAGAGGLSVPQGRLSGCLVVRRRRFDDLAGLEESSRSWPSKLTRIMAHCGCDENAQRLHPFAERYSEEAPTEPDRLHSELFRGTRTGGIGLRGDLQDFTSWQPSPTSAG